jgi:hypothetical protein
MISPVKIKIECEDMLLNSAIASAIADGLQRADFDNVMVKSLMVYQEVNRDPITGVPQDFEKKNIINDAGAPAAIEQAKRPPLITTELLPTWVLAHPYCVDELHQRAPEQLHSPVLIDQGIEPTEYTRRLQKFISGEVKADNRDPYAAEQV